MKEKGSTNDLGEKTHIIFVSKKTCFTNGRLEDSNGGNNSEIPNCQAAKM